MKISEIICLIEKLKFSIYVQVRVYILSLKKSQKYALPEKNWTETTSIKMGKNIFFSVAQSEKQKICFWNLWTVTIGPCINNTNFQLSAC